MWLGGPTLSSDRSASAGAECVPRSAAHGRRAGKRAQDAKCPVVQTDPADGFRPPLVSPGARRRGAEASQGGSVAGRREDEWCALSSATSAPVGAKSIIKAPQVSLHASQRPAPPAGVVSSTRLGGCNPPSGGGSPPEGSAKAEMTIPSVSLQQEPPWQDRSTELPRNYVPKQRQAPTQFESHCARRLAKAADRAAQLVEILPPEAEEWIFGPEGRRDRNRLWWARRHARSFC